MSTINTKKYYAVVDVAEEDSATILCKSVEEAQEMKTLLGKGMLDSNFNIYKLTLVEGK